MEVDSPERMNIAVAELDDYPPKIVFDLFPIDEKSPPAELKVMGLKEECSFMIANERKFQIGIVSQLKLFVVPCRFARCGH